MGLLWICSATPLGLRRGDISGRASRPLFQADRVVGALEQNSELTPFDSISQLVEERAINKFNHPYFEYNQRYTGGYWEQSRDEKYSYPHRFIGAAVPKDSYMPKAPPYPRFRAFLELGGEIYPKVKDYSAEVFLELAYTPRWQQNRK